MDRDENSIVAGTDAPGEDEMAALASQGYRSIIDLRTGREPGQLLSPEQEKEKAQSCGLRYLHLPVESANINPATTEHFRLAVSQMPGPVYVHCSSGRRAQAVVAAARASADAARRRA